MVLGILGESHEAVSQAPCEGGPGSMEMCVPGEHPPSPWIIEWQNLKPRLAIMLFSRLSVVGVKGIKGRTRSMPLLICHGTM